MITWGRFFEYIPTAEKSCKNVIYKTIPIKTWSPVVAVDNFVFKCMRKCAKFYVAKLNNKSLRVI